MAELFANSLQRAATGLTAKLGAARKSTKDLVALQHVKDLPTDASAYEILDDCGRGVSATVHRARIKTDGEIVAVKLMNLESMNCDLDEIIHEAQTMRSYNHPNVLPLYTSFVNGQELWMVTPFVGGGSVLHIMKYQHPDGLSEEVIATIGREVLKALDYVHKNGGIHRDVKAGNILVDLDGAVKLGDFGVSTSVERGGSWGHDKQARMTFVGTPCWMAPEVMEQTTGYDTSADIWSFGITLLEMCHGHAPFAKFPPMKVLLMTLQNPAPTLEDKGKKHFSRALKDLVARCLQKEKDKRPAAAQLLEHKFFKIAKDADYLKKTLMTNLPTLAERVQQIRTGKAATNVVDNDRNLERSQEEYRKGVSSWNFDMVALKAQAALETDDEPSGHGGGLGLPTISETDEREDTLSGATASAVAQFVQQQRGGAPTGDAAASSSGHAGLSVFATMAGQESTVRTNAIQPLAAPLALADAGNDVPLSPSAAGEGASPAGLSREGSVTGSLNTLATTTTPTAVTKQKKGRFEVSEHPAPMSTNTSVVGPLPSSAAAASGLGHSQSFANSGPSISGGAVPDLSTMRSSSMGVMPETAASRASDDGGRLTQTREGEVEESVSTIEPKQRGRFKIVAEQGAESRPLSKASSLANLADAKNEVKSKSDGGGSALGKPPPGPSSIIPPVSVVLPKLQELLDHSNAHQAALQKLLAAVQECEKGRVPLLLSRSASTKSLFENKELDSADALKFAVMDLQAKVTNLEEENQRLRERNKVLETLHGASESAQVRLQGPGPSGEPGPMSPPAASSPRASDVNTAVQ